MTLLLQSNLGFAWGDPAEAPPTVAGIEYAVPENRMHYHVPRNRMHQHVPENRQHQHVPEEDQ